MFVPNTHLCRESKFVAILRSKLRFLLRKTQIDSDFTQNFWVKIWWVGSLVYTLQTWFKTYYRFQSVVFFFFTKLHKYFFDLRRDPQKMDKIHAVLTTSQIYKSWYQLGLGSQKGPTKSQLCSKSHPYSEMPSKFLNSKSWIGTCTWGSRLPLCFLWPKK